MPGTLEDGDDLTTSQAAELLNVSTSYVCMLVEQGKLPGSLVDGRRWIKRADLVAYERAAQDKRNAALASRSS